MNLRLFNLIKEKPVLVGVFVVVEKKLKYLKVGETKYMGDREFKQTFGPVTSVDEKIKELQDRFSGIYAWTEKEEDND